MSLLRSDLEKDCLGKAERQTKRQNLTWRAQPFLRDWVFGTRGSEIESNFEVEKTKVKQNTVRFEEPETSNDSRHTTGIS